jgi:hypothetical protein
MKKIFGFLIGASFVLTFFHLPMYSQVSVNTDGTPPVNSAMLQVKSTEKGFLPPCMTSAKY